MAKFTTRPVIMGRHYVVTSGHYLATAAGHQIMAQGGNAMDAAVAMGLCLNLLEPHNNSLGGEAPTLVYSAREKKVYAVSGLGWSPAALSLDWCRQHGIDLIPGDGYIPACVPAMLDTWALNKCNPATCIYNKNDLQQQAYRFHSHFAKFLYYMGFT